jgi:hypothetical protein
MLPYNQIKHKHIYQYEIDQAVITNERGYYLVSHQGQDYAINSRYFYSVVEFNENTTFEHNGTYNIFDVKLNVIPLVFIQQEDKQISVQIDDYNYHSLVIVSDRESYLAMPIANFSSINSNILLVKEAEGENIFNAAILLRNNKTVYSIDFDKFFQATLY